MQHRYLPAPFFLILIGLSVRFSPSQLQWRIHGLSVHFLTLLLPSRSASTLVSCSTPCQSVSLILLVFPFSLNTRHLSLPPSSQLIQFIHPFPLICQPFCPFPPNPLTLFCWDSIFHTAPPHFCLSSLSCVSICSSLETIRSFFLLHANVLALLSSPTVRDHRSSYNTPTMRTYTSSRRQRHRSLLQPEQGSPDKRHQHSTPSPLRPPIQYTVPVYIIQASTTLLSSNHAQTDHPQTINISETPSLITPCYFLYPQAIISLNLSKLRNIKPSCRSSKTYYHSLNEKKQKIKEEMVVTTGAQRC